MTKSFRISDITIGANKPFVLIAGPCVIESREFVLKVAQSIKIIAARHKVPYIFKSSYDKANRTSIDSYRGPGLSQGLDILHDVKRKVGVPVLTDVHSVEEARLVGEVVDVLQIPAFLCRQTDLLIAAAATGKVVNVKKGQFLAPWDMKQPIKKIESAGNKKIIITERGTSFGYNTLVTDFRGIPVMRNLGYPVVFDATHSVQQPGGLGNVSGGQSEFIPLLARSAVAAGIDGVFLEVHPNPKKALSDGPNSLALGQLEKLLIELKSIDSVVKKKGR